jgi:hypothetical protein
MTIIDGDGIYGANTSSPLIAPKGILSTLDAVPINCAGYKISNTATNVSLSTGTPKTITSIDLTPGNWDIFISGIFGNASPGTYTGFYIAISTTTNTVTNSGPEYLAFNTAVPNAVYDVSACLAPLRVNLTVNTTFYLVMSATFSSGTGLGSGKIQAIRR